jgi:hypothetical protein
MSDQNSEHLFEVNHLRMYVKSERVTFVIVRVGQRRILPQ